MSDIKLSLGVYEVGEGEGDDYWRRYYIANSASEAIQMHEEKEGVPVTDNYVRVCRCRNDRLVTVYETFDEDTGDGEIGDQYCWQILDNYARGCVPTP